MNKKDSVHRIKILNLYSGLGGNRKLWGDQHDITAVELDPELCRLYQKSFPLDKVVNGDAHEYLLKNFENFDFIWASPPCPSHSRMNTMLYTFNDSRKKEWEYPDMKLYQEIILLSKWFKGKYVIENVIPYYPPLIPAQKIDRHLFWANFKIHPYESESSTPIKGSDATKTAKFHGVDISDYRGHQRKDRIARNCVDKTLGKHIFNCALGIIEHNNMKSGTLFSSKEIYG